jgi:uncharacterized Zn finger protein
MESCSRLPDCTPLSIQCRQCGVAESDDYEVVEANSIQSVRCAGCGTVVRLSVIECSVCGAETLVAWANQPTTENLGSLTCATCARRDVDEAAGTLPFA